MNDYEFFEQDDFFSDEMIEKITVLIAHVKNTIGTNADPHQPEVHDAIEKEIAVFASQNNIIQKRQIQDIKDTVMQQLAHDFFETQDRPVAQSEDERITLEAMKEIVRPNVHSATANYVQFVLPFEKSVLGEDHYDSEKFEKEFSVFRERQMAYLIEDLGGKIQRRDLPLAFDALMAQINASVLQKEQESHKEKGDKTMKQKMAVIRRVEDVMQAHRALDQSDHDGIESFWRNVANDIEKNDGLTGDDLAKTMRVFRTNLQQIHAIVVRAKSVSSPKDKGMRNDQEFREKNTEVAGEKKADQEQESEITNEHVEMLSARLNDARRLYAQKTVAHQNASLRIKGYFGASANVDDADMRVFSNDYREAWQNYRTAYSEAAQGQEQSAQRHERQKMMDIQERVAFFDAHTEAKAESIGGKISQIIKSISTKYTRLSTGIKRVFIGALLVGGVLLGGDAQHARENNAPVPTKDMQTVAAIQSNASHADEMAQVKAYQEPFRQAVDNVQAAVSQKQIDEQKTVEQQRGLTHTTHVITVEKGSSIIGALTTYLKAHADLLNDTGRTPAEMAYMVAQKFADAHSWVNLDKVYPGTSIHMDSMKKDSDGKVTMDMQITDVSFAGGPHIIPEKVKKEINTESAEQGVQKTTHEHNANELQTIKELLKKPAFNKAVAQQIAHVFGASHIATLKQIAHAPLQAFFRFDEGMTPADRIHRETVQQRLNDIIIKAQEIYGDAGMPRDHATVQSYFIRLYARAQRDSVTEKIFSI